MLGWSEATTRDRCVRLIARGLLMRHDTPDASWPRSPLLELTVLGLQALAAHWGLTPHAAVRYNGLTGGGLEAPIGTRSMLWATLRHTRGVDTFFVELAMLARRARDRGGDDALLEWRNAAACARGAVRPDGYGIYRHNGHHYGFFLEYDLATATGRDYRAKFAAYHRYRESRRVEEDFAGFPTILVVTTGPDAETRIARAIQVAGRGRLAPLPVLITTTDRITNHAESVLGAIWRETGTLARRRWLQDDETMRQVRSC